MASTIAGMSKEAPPSRTAPQFVVRMPDDEFRNRIAEAAKANNRSMNAEILARLESTFTNMDLRMELLTTVARLETSRESMQMVMEEASSQLVGLTIANALVTTTADELIEDFDSLAEITQSFIDGDVRDLAAVKASVDDLRQHRQTLEQHLAKAPKPALRPFGVVLAEREAEQNERINARVAEHVQRIFGFKPEGSFFDEQPDATSKPSPKS